MSSVDDETLHEALLSLIHITFTQEQHPEVELCIQRSVFHFDTLLQVSLRL